MAQRRAVKQPSNQHVRRSERIKKLRDKQNTTQANNSTPKKVVPKRKQNEDKDKQDTDKQETNEQHTHKAPIRSLLEPTSRKTPNNSPSNNRSGQHITNIPSNKPESSGNEADRNPVLHWVQYSTWPHDFAKRAPERDPKMDVERNSEMTEPIPSKLQRISYRQEVKTGKNPKQYSNAYQTEMANYGMIMDLEDDRVAPDDTNLQLCQNLLSNGNRIPTDTFCPYHHFGALLRAAKDRNETRLVRDIMPLLLPSAELLHICEGMADLKGIVEEINAEWTSGMIFGPHPKPDFAAGLKISAFTNQETKQLKKWSTISCPIKVTDHMYFPFLVCDVKSANGKLIEAERQIMHSASIAVKTIVELYPRESQKEVCGNILAFSVAFNHEQVKLFGHYAHMTDEGMVQFCRHPISSFLYNEPGHQGKAYNFVRKVYTDFVPVHLKRIRNALSLLASRSPESSYEVNDDNNREPPESQADMSWSIPTLRQSAMEEGQMSWMYRELEEGRKREEQHQQELRELREQQSQLQASINQLKDREGDGVSQSAQYGTRRKRPGVNED